MILPEITVLKTLSKCSSCFILWYWILLEKLARDNSLSAELKATLKKKERVAACLWGLWASVDKKKRHPRIV